MPTSSTWRAVARRQSARPLSTLDSPDTGASVCLSEASTIPGGLKRRRRVAVAARAVRAAFVTATTCTWQALAHGPLGSVLSIVLALAIGGAALASGIVERSTANGAGGMRSQAQDGMPRTGHAAATAASRSASGAASPPAPLTSDQEEYARWRYPARAIYLVESQAEADALRFMLTELDAYRVQIGARPRADMIVVAGTAEERERAADMLNHLDSVRASLNLPAMEVIDLRTR